ALQHQKWVIIDGLYSWEEYLYLKKEFPELVLLHIYANPSIRYDRLAKRKVRSFTREEAHIRDIREIERLHKGGPIAMANYVIENEGDIGSLYNKIDEL